MDRACLFHFDQAEAARSRKGPDGQSHEIWTVTNVPPVEYPVSKAIFNESDGTEYVARLKTVFGL
jgi:hypothetical protein